MAISGNQRSINIKRTVLIQALYDNLAIHKREYAEALIEYKQRLIEDLAIAMKDVNSRTAQELLKFSFRVQPPVSYESSFVDVIEMLEYSEDEVINIDAQSFKQYVKNEWSWKSSFNNSRDLYKTVGSSYNI